MTEVTSTDNSDLSEKEFLDNQTSDDGITPAPKDFTDVSPEAFGVRVKLDAALDFLKSLKGEAVEVGLSSLSISCDALRAGEQTINLTADPERTAALIAKAKSMPGVVAAGWTSGIVEMDRTIRFAAAEWRDGDKINKDKIAIGDVGRAGQNAGRQGGGRRVERQYRKTETDLQAAEPDLSRARPHRERSRSPRWSRRTNRARPTG